MAIANDYAVFWSMLGSKTAAGLDDGWLKQKEPMTAAAGQYLTDVLKWYPPFVSTSAGSTFFESSFNTSIHHMLRQHRTMSPATGITLSIKVLAPYAWQNKVLWLTLLKTC